MILSVLHKKLEMFKSILDLIKSDESDIDNIQMFSLTKLINYL